MGPVPVYILAGGESSRFGEDKARVTVDGTPLILKLARALDPIASPITVIADRAEEYADLGLRTLGDLTPCLGPIGGLQTACDDCQEDSWLLLASCDLAGLNADWVQLLLDEARDDAKAVAFRDDRWHPLLALYHASLKKMVDELVAAGRLAIRMVLDEANAVELQVPPDWRQLVNVNTKEDLARYKAERAGSPASH